MTDDALRAEVERRILRAIGAAGYYGVKHPRSIDAVCIESLALIREKVAEVQKRIDAALACHVWMCGHCIEILTGDIPPDTTLEEFTGPCTEFRRSHLYQIGCSDCGKDEAEHRTPREEERKS